MKNNDRIAQLESELAQAKISAEECLRERRKISVCHGKIIANLERRLRESEERVGLAKSALAFYADEEKWSALDNGDENMSACWFEVDRDGYRVASEALAKLAQLEVA